MKIANKILRDISIRSKYKELETKRQSLKILSRLKLISYLDILVSSSKLSKAYGLSIVKNRCFITSRSSGNYVKVSISRIKLKELAYNGLILGFVKASW